MEEGIFGNLMSVLWDYAVAVKELYQQRLIADDKVASGKLLNSIDTFVVYNNLEYVVTIKAEDYLEYVEYGRRPGKMPPVSKILEWVKVRNIMPEPRNGKLPTPENLAWAISKKIARDGILPTYSLADTLETVNRMYLPLIQEAVEKDFDAYVISTFADVARKIKI